MVRIENTKLAHHLNTTVEGKRLDRGLGTTIHPITKLIVTKVFIQGKGGNPPPQHVKFSCLDSL